MRWEMVLLVPLVCLFTIKNVVSDAVVTCKAEAVQMGAEGHVECYLQVHLRQYPNQTVTITVDHYPYKNKSESDPLLDCTRSHGEKLDCSHVKSGYSNYSLVDGNLLVIRIPKVSERHLGTYFCQVSSRKLNLSSNPCQFEINGTALDPPSKKEEMNTLPDEESDGGVSSGLSAGPIAGIAIGVIVIVGASALVVYFIRRSRRRRSHTLTEMDDVNAGPHDSAANGPDNGDRSRDDKKKVDDSPPTAGNDESEAQPFLPESAASANGQGDGNQTGRDNGRGDDHPSSGNDGSFREVTDQTPTEDSGACADDPDASPKTLTPDYVETGKLVAERVNKIEGSTTLTQDPSVPRL